MNIPNMTNAELSDGGNYEKSLNDRLMCGELTFLTNVPYFGSPNAHRRQSQILRDLRKRYGQDEVVVAEAMRDEGPVGMPGMVGIYVDAQKYRELEHEL